MRIGIVNDGLVAVEAMRRAVVGAPEHQLAWIARDGFEAVANCAADTPDLVLMDLIMPNMDGIEATRRIMAANPCPIVVVTANVNTNSAKVFEALGAGALDAVNTPVLESPAAGRGADALLAKIATIRKLVGGTGPKKPATNHVERARDFAPEQEVLIAVGASAGGPAAVAKMLGDLPADFPAGLVIVQHVDAQFVKGLADWLDFQSAIRVRLAREGDHPEPGTVYLAGGDEHLVFDGHGRLAFTSQPVESSYRPSVDVFFKSAAQHWPGDLVGVVLTGMGRDGAEGLLTLRRDGHHTIAQDEATSAVFGMPKAAAALGAASEILPLDKIGPRVTHIVDNLMKSNARRTRQL